MSGTRMRRALVAIAGLGLAALTGVPASAASSPTAVYQSSAGAAAGGFAVTITDCGVIDGNVACSNPPPLVAFDNLHQAVIALGVAPGRVVAVSNPGWSATLSGSTVTLTAPTGGDLTVGQSISVTLPVPAQAGPDGIATQAFDATGFQFTRDAPDPAYGVGLAFKNQPAETALGASIDAPVGVQVSAQDTFGSPAQGVPVTIAIGQDSAGGTLGGTTRQTTDSAGVATFPNLQISVAGFGYTLVATSGVTRVESQAFTIASTAANCTLATCSGSATDTAGTTSVSVTATGLTGPANLFLTMYSLSTYVPYANACGTTGFQGSGTRVDISGSTATPSKTINWRLDRSLVNQTPNNGASAYSICLGAVNTVNPGLTWTTKGGGSAVAEPDGMFWGLLAACADVSAGQPCITSQSKNGQGDVLIAISVPSPWDEQIVGGLLRSAGA